MFISFFRKQKIIKSNTIGIICYIPQGTKKFHDWFDGFTSAVDILIENYGIDVKYINISVDKPSLDTLNSFSFLIVKSNWGWYPDIFIRKFGKKLKVPCGLMISGSLPPPNVKSMMFYRVLWYETNWYRKFIHNHGNCIHAFGVNIDVARKHYGIDKCYDWISVGMLVPHKNHFKIIDKPGKKVVVGETVNGISGEIENRLIENKVDVLKFMNYSDYILLLNKCKNIIVACDIHGGGERAILESRACGVNVVLDSENEKLVELLTCDIYSHYYYSEQLFKGIAEHIKFMDIL